MDESAKYIEKVPALWFSEIRNFCRYHYIPFYKWERNRRYQRWKSIDSGNRSGNFDSNHQRSSMQKILEYVLHSRIISIFIREKFQRT